MNFLLTSFWLIAFGGAPLVRADTTLQYSGTARDGDKIVYTEHHTVRFDAAHTPLEAETIYKNPQGAVISTLKSDFRTSLTAPPHTIENLRTGNKQGLRWTGDAITLFNQDAGHDEETKTLPKDFGGDRVAFGCQGLNYYLLKNMETFKQQKRIPIKFLIPGNLNSYDFDVQYIKEDAEGMTEVEVEIDNWFLRLFAPKLRIRYDAKKNRIVWYQGLSNLKNDRNDNQTVTITYEYPNP